MNGETFSLDFTEVKEILVALSGLSNVNVNCPNSALVISRLTVTTNEAYLDERALAFRNEFAKHQALNKALSDIFSNYCNAGNCDNCPLSKYCNTNINIKRKCYDKDAPVMIDLFCGAGGLSLGFSQEGFITSLANDIEPCCIDTYAHNHPETPRKNIILGDIKDVVDNISHLMRFPKVDVIVGGPPCQGFSTANRQRLIDDPRNHLYKNYVRAVELVKPRFFVMENVKGMLSVADQVVEDFEAIGYNVSYRVLNAKDYGVPQNRERLIYIGNRIGVDNSEVFLKIRESSESIPNYVLGDAIQGLRPLQASRIKNSTEASSLTSGNKIERAQEMNSNSYVALINQGRECPLTFNHKARYNNDRDIEIYGRLNPGDKSDDPKIADIMPYARRNDIFKDKYFKLEADKVSKTITAHMKFDCNMYIHPTQARGLTPREAARIQSFPDDYYFRGAFTKTFMQIGNSVPPLLGRAIATVIKQYL